MEDYFVLAPVGKCYECGHNFTNGVRCTIAKMEGADCRCFPCFSAKMSEAIGRMARAERRLEELGEEV